MAQTQMKEREWELGLTSEAQIRQENGTTEPFVGYRLFRSVCGEFLGCMLFLFMVITVARFSDDRTQEGITTEATANILMISAAFGLSIFVLVYIFADVSGAHLNPAVSIGLLVGKRISVERFFLYVIAQMAGATAGAGIASTFLSSTRGGYNALADTVSAADAFGAEVLCTFLLVVTVFAACDGELGRKNAHTGPLLPLVIGMAVLLAHLVLIPIDGASINPARSFATAVTNNEWGDHWVFWVGPLLGGVLATVTWEAILRPDQVIEQEKKVPQAISV
ncbi:aquaporin [Ectocarpus siliculosus]|uniref:Aquaporin n=1 Tax=Ectocarpus siliculosus TaxID=2880 RepID=D8LTV5_ECTSI|nr:aquaporin [Ectocarpus siliculosus]|eukprot:CBN74002.1 aquaporin [Ectocarpus siliculosus]